MPPKKKVAPRVQKPSGLLKSLAETKKQDTRIVGAVERLLLAEQQGPNGRRIDCLHPSAICKADWCPRAAYFEYLNPPEREVVQFGLMNVFDEGHAIHDKWQDRLRRLGVLEGRWKCLHCGHKWWDISPSLCPSGMETKKPCASSAVKYDEVTVDGHDEYLIYGHTDGIIVDDQGRAILEIKSVGEGTVRFEEPSLLKQHTRDDNSVDLKALWDGIKRPFPSHIRQATIYGHILGIEWIVFLYECKWNQAVKEFTVKVDPKNIERILDGALDIKYALKSGKAPDCYCGKCETNERGQKDSATEESRGGSANGSGGSGSSPVEEGAIPAQPTGVGSADATGVGTRRIVRRQSDGFVRGSDTLGRLLGGSGSTG